MRPTALRYKRRVIAKLERLTGSRIPQDVRVSRLLQDGSELAYKVFSGAPPLRVTEDKVCDLLFDLLALSRAYQDGQAAYRRAREMKEA